MGEDGEGEGDGWFWKLRSVWVKMGLNGGDWIEVVGSGLGRDCALLRRF